MPSLFHPAADANAPHIDRLDPAAAMPGGEVELYGHHLGPLEEGLPLATLNSDFAPVVMARPGRTVVRIPEGTISGDLHLRRGVEVSNAVPLQVGVPMAENLHPVANPAVDADGNVYTTLSGSRGQETPVSVFKIARDFQMRPFVREVMNATGLAFGPDAHLYVSSRAEGTVYRVSPLGAVSTYAEGMGIATGIAFDGEGNLFVGDRSGTIFKIAPGAQTGQSGEIFVYATLEPSFVAYHLAFSGAGDLYVTGPTTSSHQAIHAIDRDGNTTVFYQGLGRAQGMAFDVDDNLYVAASFAGRRGIVRITPQREASLAVAGPNLLGLAFLEDGNAVLATRESLFHIGLDIEGRLLV